jgi:hypothetical protein
MRLCGSEVDGKGGECDVQALPPEEEWGAERFVVVELPTNPRDLFLDKTVALFNLPSSLTTIYYYHLLLPSVTIISYYHLLLPSLATISYYHPLLSSHTIISSYNIISYNITS